jgi:hypothetical protein
VLKNFDWLPGKRTGQLAMAKKWHTVLTDKGKQWQVTDADISELNDLIGDAEKWLDKAMAADRNAITTTRCKEAFDNLAEYMRNIKARKFFSPPLYDPDFISLGLRPRDIIYTPAADPTGQAAADITYPGPALLMLHMKTLSSTASDPRTDLGYRIYYGILSKDGASAEETAVSRRYLMEPPVTGKELPSSQFTRRKKEMFIFTAEDSGKTAYFCIHFENSKGKAGPWGPVFSAVIP